MRSISICRRVSPAFVVCCLLSVTEVILFEYTGWPVCNDMKQGSVNQVF